MKRILSDEEDGGGDRCAGIGGDGNAGSDLKRRDCGTGVTLSLVSELSQFWGTETEKVLLPGRPSKIA